MVDETTRPALKPAANGIVYLSGGNPQIAKGDGDAPVQAYIAAMPGWKSDVGKRLDELIVRSVPNVRKAVRWNSPFYGTEEHGWFVSYHVFTKYIRLTFLNGAALDPAPPGNGKDPNARWINLHEHDLIPPNATQPNANEANTNKGVVTEAQLTDWFHQSANLPAWKGF